jgi:hypothetical protein
MDRLVGYLREHQRTQGSCNTFTPEPSISKPLGEFACDACPKVRFPLRLDIGTIPVKVLEPRLHVLLDPVEKAVRSSKRGWVQPLGKTVHQNGDIIVIPPEGVEKVWVQRQDVGAEQRGDGTPREASPGQLVDAQRDPLVDGILFHHQGELPLKLVYDGFDMVWPAQEIV